MHVEQGLVLKYNTLPCLYEKYTGSGAKWFGGAEYVSRAPITGLGADENASSLTFGVSELLGNPDIYGWLKEAGDSLRVSKNHQIK